MSLALFWAGLPKWAQDALKVIGAVLAVILLGKIYVKAKEHEAVQRDRAKQRERQTKEATERVEAFSEGARAVERMPERELRRSTESDPDNRGRVLRN